MLKNIFKILCISGRIMTNIYTSILFISFLRVLWSSTPSKYDSYYIDKLVQSRSESYFRSDLLPRCNCVIFRSAKSGCSAAARGPSPGPTPSPARPSTLAGSCRTSSTTLKTSARSCQISCDRENIYYTY